MSGDDDWIAGVVDGWLFTSPTPLPTTMLVPLENPHLHDQTLWDRALGASVERNGLIALHGAGSTALGVARPVLGGPAVAMLAHAAARRGVERIVGVGFCGATQPDLRTGDVVIAERAHGGDGVSNQYLALSDDRHRTHEEPIVKGSPELVAALAGLGRTGTVHTVAAVHLETRDLVQRCQHAGVLGIDMETAALYAVGAALNVQTVSCLLVTDVPALEVPAQGAKIAAAEEALLLGVIAALTERPKDDGEAT